MRKTRSPRRAEYPLCSARLLVLLHFLTAEITKCFIYKLFQDSFSGKYFKILIRLQTNACCRAVPDIANLDASDSDHITVALRARGLGGQGVGPRAHYVHLNCRVVKNWSHLYVCSGERCCMSSRSIIKFISMLVSGTVGFVFRPVVNIDRCLPACVRLLYCFDRK